jgi:hypothetical protein
MMLPADPVGASTGAGRCVQLEMRLLPGRITLAVWATERGITEETYSPKHLMERLLQVKQSRVWKTMFPRPHHLSLPLQCSAARLSSDSKDTRKEREPSTGSVVRN